jgi:hypothetical protein
VGLTSTRNVAFCESLGVYDRVVAYDAFASRESAAGDVIDAFTPCVYVDFAGDSALRRAVHTRFTRLAYSCAVGVTHAERFDPTARDLPGPRPVFFFAPERVAKRRADWGAEELSRRLGEAWHVFRKRVMDPAAPWLVVRRHAGEGAFASAHAVVLAGGGDAREGHVIEPAA